MAVASCPYHKNVSTSNYDKYIMPMRGEDSQTQQSIRLEVHSMPGVNGGERRPGRQAADSKSWRTGMKEVGAGESIPGIPLKAADSGIPPLRSFR